ncbi:MULTISPECIES: glutathione binding-like protein [unclassified Sphingomonas]|uniref:glutathione binding-like protein n=1 Tax=unclassified Sphingomonas TaxID=196159 RepID=UPI002269EC95|nr:MULTISPECIES: glutathione binding-like protein [unclassified Sphingomonas]
MGYVEGTIHAQGFARIFVPAQLGPREAVQVIGEAGASDVKLQGREIVERGLALLDPALATNEFAAGDRFTIADAALFYVERWTPRQGIELPSNVARHYDRMLARPAVDRVLRLWGEA